MPHPDPYPIPTFHFTAQVDGTDEQSSFQEAAGIAPEIEAEGEENRFAHVLPKEKKHTNLVLKRGAVAKDSLLFRWCGPVLQSSVESPIEPKALNVYLLNEQGDRLMGWSFVNAYPVKWEIADFNAITNEANVESIELSYDSFNRIDLGKGSTGLEAGSHS
jgi:phage tail-like protein